MKTLKIILILFISILTISCGLDDSGNSDSTTDFLIGRWLRESTEDINGNVTNDAGDCLVTEFTSTLYIVTDFTGIDCTELVSSESSTYVINAFDIFINGSSEINFKIVQLDDTTLKLRVFDDGDGNTTLDTITYSKLN